MGKIVEEFMFFNEHNGILNPDRITFISRVAQLLASVPDKARMGASSALTSPYPFYLQHSISSSPNYSEYIFLVCCGVSGLQFKVQTVGFVGRDGGCSLNCFPC